MRITKVAVEHLTYSKEPGTRLNKKQSDKPEFSYPADYHWDDALKGFGVRVYPSGRCSFVVSYRTDGNVKRFHTLGDFGRLTVEAARKLAKERLAEVLKGGDPQADRKARRTAPTVAELCDRYLLEYAETKKRASSIKQDRRMIETRVKPALGKCKVASIARSDLYTLHHSLRQTPYEANRVLALVSKMMNLAERWGLRPDGTNPTRHVERYREKKRERFLSDAELLQLGDALIAAERDTSISRSAIAATRLLVFTGCRLSEVLTLKWDYVDLERGVMRLPETKSGAKSVYLGPPAMQVLADMPRVEGNPYVITGNKAGEHLSNLHDAWHQIRDMAGLKDVRIHDLRHSFASVGAATGLSLPMIGKMLGHTQVATTQRYAHLADDPVKSATNIVTTHIENAMTRKQSDNVVSLRQGSDK